MRVGVYGLHFVDITMFLFILLHVYEARCHAEINQMRLSENVQFDWRKTTQKALVASVCVGGWVATPEAEH